MYTDNLPSQDETPQSSYFFAEPKSEAKTFLVVEDDFTYQPLWEKIIKTVDPKAQIRWCLTAEGAEELMRKKENFDVIIADIFLAGPRTGIDLWKRFKNSNSQFLFASGMPLRTFAETIGDHTGIHPYLIRKPLNPKECVEALRTLLAYKHCF